MNQEIINQNLKVEELVLVRDFSSGFEDGTGEGDCEGFSFGCGSGEGTGSGVSAGGSDGDVSEMQSEIIEIQIDCNKENWDGYGAKPISLDSARRLIKFYKNNFLHLNIENPEITPISDGTIGLEWVSSSHNNRLIIIPKSENIVYASVTGGRKRHGDININDRVPEEVYQILEHYFKQKQLVLSLAEEEKKNETN